MPKHQKSKPTKSNRFSLTLDYGYKYEQMSKPASEFADQIKSLEHLETTEDKDLGKIITIQRKLGSDIMKQDSKVSKQRIVENLLKKQREMHNNFQKKINAAKFDLELEQEKLELLKHQWLPVENGDKMGELISNIKTEFA